MRREWPTEIGPVDLMCRDEDDAWVAVEIKRVGTIEAVEQLDALPRAHPRSTRRRRLRGRPRGERDQAAGATLAESRGIRCVEVALDELRGLREPELTLFAV